MQRDTIGKAKFLIEYSTCRQQRYHLHLHSIVENHKNVVLDIAADRALRSSSVKIFSPDHPVPQ